MLETRKRLRETIDTQIKQIHAREKLLDEQREEIRMWKEENRVLYEQGKDLRNEVEELKLFRDNVINIVKAKGTIVDKYDKIKELVDDVESYN